MILSIQNIVKIFLYITFSIESIGIQFFSIENIVNTKMLSTKFSIAKYCYSQHFLQKLFVI